MIPFNKPYMTGKELWYIAEVIQQGHSAGDGPFTRKCQRLLEDVTGAGKALLTTSCTDALEMAALLLNIQPGDEVIAPAFTFVSTINAFALRGARPVFADVRADTLNLDETRLEALITPRTRAIVPVHYAGVGCEMEAIMDIARRCNVPVVEDNAHGLFGRYKDQALGTFGSLATQSFHETKNIICGEGGALLLNDPALVERAEIIREKGTNRSRFFRGQVDKYTWVDFGSSFLPSDIMAAFLYAQLEARDDVQARRKRLWDTYHYVLPGWAEANGIRLPVIPAHCEQAYHMYYLLLPSLADRAALITHLKQRDILSVFHYLPLHLSHMGRQFGGRAGDCPVTEDVSDRLLRLPFYNGMTESEQEQVVAALQTFCCKSPTAAAKRGSATMNRNGQGFVFIALTIVFTVAGQLLVKMGMNALARQPGKALTGTAMMMRAFTNGQVVIGLSCAVVAALCWIVAVSKTDLSFAYPFMGLAIALVLALTPAVLGETVPPARWVGVLVVCLGLWLASRN